MKKVDGFYWDTNPDWRHDKWKWRRRGQEFRIWKKMIADRQWVLDMVEDLRPIVKELGALDDVNSNAGSEIIWLELMRKMVHYQAVAISMYEVPENETD